MTGRRSIRVVTRSGKMRTVRQIEIEMIGIALKLAPSVTAASKMLGISRSGMYRKLAEKMPRNR